MKLFIRYIKGIRLLRLFLVTGFISLISCEDFLEVDLPNNQLTAEAVFEDYRTAEAAVLNIYTGLRDNAILTGSSNGIGISLGLYADDLDLYTTSLNLQQFYQNALLPSNNLVTLYWNSGYNLIYNANAVIENVSNSENLTDEERERLSGEALFFRGLIHFYLTNLYGDIPYVTSTKYLQNKSVGKINKDEVYERVISDLKEAEDLLSGTDQSFMNTRITTEVVTALLARIYLYNGQYELAEASASSIVNSGNFQLLEDLSSVFLNTSPETIWQFGGNTPGNNTIEAQSFIFSSIPPPNYALTDDLVNSFMPNDERRIHWIKSVGDSINSYYHSYKYKENQNTGSTLENSIILRLPEQFLIRAEARLMMGDVEGALADLNMIRNRAGLASLEDPVSNLLLEILEERRREFFSEFGHRFFDMKRLEVLDEILGEKKEGWETTDERLPIPEQELLSNPDLLPQNPGYN